MKLKDARPFVLLGVLAIVLSFGVFVTHGMSEEIDEERQVLAERSATMKTFAGTMRVLRGYLQERNTREDAEEAARVLHFAALRLHDLFPEGTGSDNFDDSKALPAIWQNRDEFTNTVNLFAHKAELVLAAIRHDDLAELEHAFQSLGSDGCAYCHKNFRAEHTH